MHIGHGPDAQRALILTITSTTPIAPFICESGAMVLTQALEEEGQRRKCKERAKFPVEAPPTIYSFIKTKLNTV